MFWELFRFEFYYRRRRPTTYVYFFVIFITSFITLTSPTLSVANTSDSTSANAPYTIAVLMVVLSFLFTLITSSLVGVAVIRDVDHQIAPIIFTTRVKKGAYLFGRFAGSLLVLIILNSGIIFGALTAYLAGAFVPWEITWQTKQMLPFDLWSYLQPFLIFSVSNILITGSIFFAAGALIRKPVVIYSQGIALLMIYQLANTFYLRDMDSQRIAALVDPFGVQTFLYMTRYWTPVEQNTLLVPFEDVMLYNRVIWLSLALIILGTAYWRFSFTTRSASARKSKAVDTTSGQPTPIAVPDIARSKGASGQLRQLLSTTSFHFRDIWKEVPFLAIAGAGLLVLLVNSIRMGKVLGTSSYPTTNNVITMLGSFGLFFAIIMIFYSGEIVWKERQSKIHSIIDATPVPGHVALLSKYLALCLVYLSFLVAFFIYGIILQAMQGYYQFDIPAYFGKLSETFINLCLFTVVAILVQTISRNKFLGFVIVVMIVLLINLLPLFGVEHEMFAYASGTLGEFSQMNGFGHLIVPFVWLKSYWAALALVFFVAAVVFHKRKERLRPSMKVVAIVGLLSFVGMGTYIHYNTLIINRFENTREVKAAKVIYDEELKRLESIVQPSVTEINLSVDVYPARRGFEAKGYYYLNNHDSVPIGEILVRLKPSPDLKLHDLSFQRSFQPLNDKDIRGRYLFRIDPPLAPGDSLRMDFKVDLTQNGFKSKTQNTDVVYNGTLLRNEYFPQVGHEHQIDRARFKAIVSTDSTQIALAPGQLTKTWSENDRNFYQYETSESIPNVYGILSGRYELKKDKWNDINIEIYYHHAHEFNIDRMIQSIKDGLTYYSKNFGSTINSPVRLAEFPRYTTQAQSFPGVIAFSEGAGFISKVANPSKDLDVPYYLTAHELAHQWWGQQVVPASAPGKAMLLEGLAQYSAIMVLVNNLPLEDMQGYLRYELNTYLRGRAAEKQKELPLISVGDQQYISYNKSALVFYGLQDYIGADSLNSALRRFREKWASKRAQPVSKDLVDEIRKVTPDTLGYLIGDLFEHITLYENKVNESAYSILANDRYEITMTISTQKLQVDASGAETPVQTNDWIDVGIYGEDAQGKPKLIYLKKHKFTRPKSTLTITTSEKPVKVGIDPLHKLVDHQPVDNVISVGTLVELSN